MINKNKKWYIIDWDSGLERCKKILKLYPITDQTNKDIFLIFGYKNLSSGDKETYYLLKELAELNEQKYNFYSCQVSLDYLAIVLNTTIFCQTRRISKLKQVGLVQLDKSNRKQFSANIYIPLRRVLPDSTLIETLITLIRRKQLIKLIEKYTQERDIITNPTSLQEIKLLIKKIPSHMHLLDKDLKNRIFI